MGESDAVGTPVITHRLGASSEILDHPHQETVDCRNPRLVIERVMAWYRGERPRVLGRSQFRLTRILKDWINLLGV